MRYRYFGLAAAIVALAAPAASASIVIAYGVAPGSTENLLATGAGVVNGPSLSVTGRLDTLLLDISTDENVTYTGGQATLESETDGDLFGAAVTFMANAATPFGFQIFEFNPDVDFDGSLLIEVFLANMTSTSASLDVDANGNNRIHVVANDPSEIISKIVVTSFVGLDQTDIIENIKQVRIGGVSPLPDPNAIVPEMSSIAVWACLAAVCGFGARRQSSLS